MLTAALALSTTVLFVVVVVTMSTLPPAASPPSLSDGDNPAGPAPKVMDARSYGEVYGWDIQQKPADHGDAGERHAKPVSDYAH